MLRGLPKKIFRALFTAIGQTIFWLGIALLWIIGLPLGWLIFFSFHLLCWIYKICVRIWDWVWSDEKPTKKETK